MRLTLIEELLALLLLYSLFCIVNASYESSLNGIEHTNNHMIPSAPTINGVEISKKKQKSPAKFKRGQSRRGLVVVKDTLEERAEQYFDGNGIGANLPSEHYDGQYKAFDKAMQESYIEVHREFPNEVAISAIAKSLYMDKIVKYHHRRVMMKGRERLRRVNKIETTLEEFEALRNHFFNNEPMEGNSPAERKRLTALKVYYRKQLAMGKQSVLDRMHERGWTLEGLKKHTLPDNDKIMDFLNRYRAETETKRASTSHVAIPIGRSNPELDLDLNEPLSDDESIGEKILENQEESEAYDLDLDRHLMDLHLDTWNTNKDDLYAGLYNDDNQDPYTAYDADCHDVDAMSYSDMLDESFDESGMHVDVMHNQDTYQR